MKRTTHSARLFTRTLGPLSLAALALTACSDDGTAATTTVLPLAPRVVVTSVKGDVESELIAAIYAGVLEESGFRVARKDAVDMDRAGYYQALQDGDFQLIPDHSGDLLQFVYSQPGAEPTPTTIVPAETATTQAPILITTTTLTPSSTSTGDTGSTTAETTADTGTDDTADTTTSDTATDDTATDDTATDDTTPTGTTTTGVEATTTTTVAAGGNGRSIPEQVIAINAAMPTTIIVSNGATAENKPVIACTEATMAAHTDVELRTLTNLASIAPDIRLAGPASFMDDDSSGYAALMRYYGGEYEDLLTVEEADVAAAIDADTADCFVVNSLNTVITAKKLTIMIDQLWMVPSNAVVALLSSTVSTPELMAALDGVGISLSTERLNSMLYEIEVNGSDPVVVANAFIDTLLG